MSINIPRTSIVDEPDITSGEISSLTYQITDDSQIAQLMELSSLMEKETFVVSDQQGAAYQFQAFANLDLGTQPPRAILTIHGPVTRLRSF